MAICGKCIHLDVCKSADACDGHVPRCKHFMDKDGMALASCKLGAKGCFTDGKCRYSKPCGNKVVTRADQIRAMSNMELAKVFTQAVADGCPPKMDWDCQKDKEGWEACENCWCKYLQQPVEEGAL